MYTVDDVKEIYKFKNRASDEEIIQNINDGLNLDISNFAILICAILIASIGLNMNSVAVIIGAMLISPLMGAIIGIGYGIGTYNTDYIKKSFVLLIFEIAISLATATLYFLLTPVKGASAEMISRTTPTIFDVVIAFVGGTAGMIGLSRKRPGNVLPGVAIATALMPPLCTAGYGIAHLNIKIFLGAGYLFFINSFFIAVSTFLVVKALKLPKKTFIDKKREKNIKRLTIILSILVMIPSVISAATMVTQTVNDQNLNNFINTQINKNSYVLNKSINKANKEINLVIFGSELTNNNIQDLDSKLQYYGFPGYKLKVTQDQSLNLVSYIEKLQQDKNNPVSSLDTNKDENSSQSNNNSNFSSIGNQLKALYPQITDVVIGKGEHTLTTNNNDSTLLVFISEKGKNSLNKDNIKKYLQEATGYKNIILTID